MTTQEMLKLAKEAKTSMMLADTDTKNAALLAIQILALSDKTLADKLLQHKIDMANEVNEKDKKLQSEIDNL